jgi:hypothetical protein
MSNETGKLWIQYTYDNTGKAAVLQTANNREEAMREDHLFKGCPWYWYDIEPPKRKGSDGNLVNETGPIYFGENSCRPEYRAGVSGLWYLHPRAAGHTNAVRCANCINSGILRREEDETGLKWMSRVAVWWEDHKAEQAESIRTNRK